MDALGQGDKEGDGRKEGSERRFLVDYKAELMQGENGTALLEQGRGLSSAARSLSAVLLSHGLSLRSGQKRVKTGLISNNSLG